MDFLIIAVVALFFSILTFFSGFGLGTLLMPIFSIFMPLNIAVASTAIVHLLNNVLKIVFTGKYVDHKIISSFGIPAIFAAWLGVMALDYISHFQEVIRYTVFSKVAVVTPIKLVMAFVMLFFVIFETIPSFRKIQFKKDHLFIGGVLSGFFGGFSGHQGALRSAFLAKTGLSTEAFIGTNSAIGVMVDFLRVSLYGIFFLDKEVLGNNDYHLGLVTTGILFALIGTIIGKQLLSKVKMKSVQLLTTILLFVIAVLLGLGIV